MLKTFGQRKNRRWRLARVAIGLGFIAVFAAVSLLLWPVIWKRTEPAPDNLLAPGNQSVREQASTTSAAEIAPSAKENRVTGFWHQTAGPAPGQTIPLPDRIRGAYVVSLSRNAQWPSNSLGNLNTPFLIGFFGPLSYGQSIPRNRLLHHRSVTVVQFDSHTNIPPNTLKELRVLVFTARPTEATTRLLQDLRRLPILTIGEDNHFLQQGGMVQLFSDGQHIRFRLNEAAVREAGLAFSNKALQIASPSPLKPSP